MIYEQLVSRRVYWSRICSCGKTQPHQHGMISSGKTSIEMHTIKLYQAYNLCFLMVRDEKIRNITKIPFDTTTILEYFEMEYQ